MAKLSMNMKQLQTLKMTPQLQQAIKMLQMSRLELETTLREEMENNPLLEEVIEQEGTGVHQIEVQEKEVKSPEVPDQEHDGAEFNWESYFDRDRFSATKGMTNFAVNSDEIINYENIISSRQSLHDYLSWQAKMSGLSEEEEKIADLIIDYINDDGYLTVSLQELAETEKIPLETLEKLLKVIQELDPPGVGARDLKECLLLQAKAYEEDTSDLVQLIENHLPHLEKKQWDQIAKAMGKEVAEVKELAAIVSAMDPKPGRAYMSQDVQYVVHDVYVYKLGDEIIITLNEDGLPRLKLANYYKDLLNQSQESAKGSATTDFLKEKLSSAVWLIRSLQQRQKTIYRVTEAIMRYQSEFLDKGPQALKPLILKNIANELGVHESTVSRVTSNKYVHTPQGVFELKYFFNSGFGSAGGEGVASEAVKLRIKALIESEDPRFPLSDQELVDRLRAEGIDIARRTVAKYREALRILPSSQRRQK
ncbi:MAG: RNA polymerase factor sigma-54 [Bdellovibrionaceae bacterium]|nr:RNA polymerase factor sigma-54 [Pseudobdellovibrionaceae bacterium]